jgi:two-component system, cell cycle response regulator DivK
MAKMKNPRRLILVVDDSADDREMYDNFLSANGFRVSLACDGEEALEKAAKLQPDLIIMDLGLPGVGGWEAIRRLKGKGRTRQIPIVVLTGRAFASAHAVGSDGCLTKPCHPDKLLTEINRVLEPKSRPSQQHAQLALETPLVSPRRR